MDVRTFLRLPTTEANPEPEPTIPDVVRVETDIFADDGQQYQIWLLDADDSFDVVVRHPNGVNEVVWSIVRERTMEG